MDCKFKTGDYAYNILTEEKVTIWGYTLDDYQTHQLKEIRYYNHIIGFTDVVTLDSGYEYAFYTEEEYKIIIRSRKLKDLLS